MAKRQRKGSEEDLGKGVFPEPCSLSQVLPSAFPTSPMVPSYYKIHINIDWSFRSEPSGSNLIEMSRNVTTHTHPEERFTKLLGMYQFSQVDDH